MREEKIENMDFKELRKEVLRLRDELALFIRKYNDTIYNLDSDNFGKSFTVEQKNMKAQLKLTAEGLKSTVSKTDLAAELESYSTIEQTADAIKMEVNAEREYVTNLLGTNYYTKAEVESQISLSADGFSAAVTSVTNRVSDVEDSLSDVSDNIETLSADINVNANEISAIVKGSYTESLLKGYLTGIVIEPKKIKMINDSAYSVYSKDGLHFYNGNDDIQGWAIEPSAAYGGVLNYYINGGCDCSIGQGYGGDGYDYSTSDMTVKVDVGRFVVDVADSENREIKFVGLNQFGNTPYIYANEQLLATQAWVLANGGGSGGTVTAVFG